MSIAAYLREIGRGRDGARDLTRAQAADLMRALLRGGVSDLELGAWCVAMRYKGEAVEELAGFLQAVMEDCRPVPAGATPTVVLPSYNGARRLPVLTPWLALALAARGCRVIVHGQRDDPGGRLTSHAVLQELARHGLPVEFPHEAAGVGDRPGAFWLPTAALHPGLQRLLDVRRTLGLRNSAHTLVKLLAPCPGALLVSSYTHPDYRERVSALLVQTGQWAMLLRGTEGEPVADPRRRPRIDIFEAGRPHTLCEAQPGVLPDVPELPDGRDRAATVAWTVAQLQAPQRSPEPLRFQLEAIVRLLQGRLRADTPRQTPPHPERSAA